MDLTVISWRCECFPQELKLADSTLKMEDFLVNRI